MGLDLKTDLIGKIRNLPDFKNEALLPVFEAVANAIQAIEENNNIHFGEVKVKIIRSTSNSFPGLESEEDTKIISFEIEDNGIGFNDTNFTSFMTAETTHKLEKGGKGVGRFFWLKAFERVEIASVYLKDGVLMLRQILFSPKDGIKEITNVKTKKRQGTVVKLIDFKEEYRKQPSAYKTTGKIAQRILEHCLSYFITDAAPSIIIEDGEEQLLLKHMFKEMRSKIRTEPLEINKEKFNVSHIRLYSTHSEMHNLVFCANSRDVKRNNLARILGTSSQFDEEDRKFTYAAYVTGSYLDSHVDSSRTDFEIPENAGEVLRETYPVSMDELRSSISKRSKEYLAPYLEAVINKKKDLVSKHIEQKNPTLRSVPHYCPEVYDEIEPNSSDEKINEILYKYKGRSELQIRAKHKELLKTQAQSIDEIKQEYEDITRKLESFQKDQLAQYTIFRKMIIELLDKKLQMNTKGDYHNEDIVHDIIFPRKSTTDEINYDDHNLWLIDETLTFHEFAISDRGFHEFTDSKNEERPDVVTFAEIDDDRIARAVSVLEFKKPQRKKFEEDPTKQLYRYVREIKRNKCLMPNGRVLQTNETTRFYCYAICDLTLPVREFAENNNYAELKGEFGFYNYNRNHNANTWIISFDKIVVDATRRHRAFFEKLAIHD